MNCKLQVNELQVEHIASYWVPNNNARNDQDDLK